MARHASKLVPAAALLGLGGLGGLASAAEITVQNDSLCEGCVGAIQVGFISGETAASWLTSPCDGTIVAVQVAWFSLTGGALPTVEECITIHADGSFPTPGVALEVLEGPVMQDGGLNEFRWLDEDMTIPLEVPISQGERFVVGFTFFNDPDILNGPSVVTDVDGCQTPLNSIFAIPGGWLNVCVLGISGDFVIRAVIDCESLDGSCCLDDGTCVESTSMEECANLGGTYQGDGVACPPACPEPPGACCFSDPDGCADLTLNQCTIAGGTWQGAGTDCGSIDCNPIGACCLADGSCLDATAEDDCLAMGGVFQGDGVACGPDTCPAPTGACCLDNGACLAGLEETNCTDIPGATWAGADTDCTDGDGNGTADACETPCEWDLDGDDAVGITDLLALLAAWGAPYGITDLLELLAAWGPCP